MGGDPNQAARNVDAYEQEATNLAGGKERVPADEAGGADEAPPPNTRFNNHTQSVAGVLIAKEEEFKRDNAQLDLRQQDADRALDEATKNARAAYQQAVSAAEEVQRQAIAAAAAVRDDAVAQIVEERGNLAHARRAIDAALDVLSR